MNSGKLSFLFLSLFVLVMVALILQLLGLPSWIALLGLILLALYWPHQREKS